MKRIILFCIFLPLFGFAQKQDTTYYEDSDESGSFPFSFTLPAISYSKIADKNSFSLGGSANIYFNKHWYIGVFGDRLAQKQMKSETIDSVYYENLQLGYGYIGPMLGYILFPNKKMSIYTSLRYGVGVVSLIKGQSFVYSNKVVKDNFNVIIPNVDIIYNALPSFRLCASVGYKYNMGIADKVYTNKNFNSPYISLSILFGIFPE